jgi:hypothetical protein
VAPRQTGRPGPARIPAAAGTGATSGKFFRMRVFFDVDYTILGQDGSLRPGTREVFELLTDSGHEVFIWSGFGDRSREIERHGIGHLVSGYFTKPLTNLHLGPEGWPHPVPFPPDFVVDDHPGLVNYHEGIVVTAYIDDRHDSDDVMMREVYPAILTVAETAEAS